MISSYIERHDVILLVVILTSIVLGAVAGEIGGLVGIASVCLLIIWVWWGSVIVKP